MARVRRIDYSSLKAPTRRADGSLVADAILTRTGVFTYRNTDGSERREYRPPTQVFDAASLASFKLVPITDDHPPQMLTAQNARQYQVGTVGESIRKDGAHVAATIAIHDAATIAKMDGGKTAVSCGYECDLEETPGVSPDGERYDAVQTNIVGNHLAIVHTARAGSAAAVRMDAAHFVADNDLDAEQRNKLSESDFAGPNRSFPIENAAHVRDAIDMFEHMPPASRKSGYQKIIAAAKRFGVDTTDFEKKWAGRLDSIDILIADARVAVGLDKPRLARVDGDVMDLTQALAALAAAQEKLGAEKARADTAEAALKTATTRADTAEAKLDESKKAIESLTKERNDAISATPGKVRARVELETKAAAVMPKEFKLDALNDREIRVAVIKHVSNAEVGADKSEAYVEARFDAAIERAATSTEVFQRAHGVIEANRSVKTDDLGEQAKAQRNDKAKSLFIKPDYSHAGK